MYGKKTSEKGTFFRKGHMRREKKEVRQEGWGLQSHPPNGAGSLKKEGLDRSLKGGEKL